MPVIRGNTTDTRRSMKKVMKVVKLKIVILTSMMMRWVTSQGSSSSLLSSLMETVRSKEKMKCRMVNIRRRESREDGLSDMLLRNEMMPRVIWKYESILDNQYLHLMSFP